MRAFLVALGWMVFVLAMVAVGGAVGLVVATLAVILWVPPLVAGWRAMIRRAEADDDACAAEGAWGVAIPERSEKRPTAAAHRCAKAKRAARPAFEGYGK